MISELKELKERFGKLGLYLIERAKNEINDINQKTIFQIAEIKKRYREIINDNGTKIKTNFIETYNKQLNSSLSLTLLKIKEEILNLKNRLISSLIIDLKQLLIERIKNNYSSYLKFLTTTISEIKPLVDKPPEVVISLNSRDYEYFLKNFDQLQNIFKNQVTLNTRKEDFIGGFRISQISNKISYDFSLANLMNKKRSVIEIEFSKIFSDVYSEIEEIIQNYENFIQDQKLALQEYLKDYD
ncbi:MAG: V-type ATP synthase subunit E family protein [Candidatus Heimdallarchaeota archaeon]